MEARSCAWVSASTRNASPTASKTRTAAKSSLLTSDRWQLGCTLQRTSNAAKAASDPATA